MEVELICNIIFISCVQHSDSVFFYIKITVYCRHYSEGMSIFASFSFLKTFLLAYSGFTELCSFLLYSKVNQL